MGCGASAPQIPFQSRTIYLKNDDKDEKSIVPFLTRTVNEKESQQEKVNFLVAKVNGRPWINAAGIYWFDYNEAEAKQQMRRCIISPPADFFYNDPIVAGEPTGNYDSNPLPSETDFRELFSQDYGWWFLQQKNTKEAYHFCTKKFIVEDGTELGSLKQTYFKNSKNETMVHVWKKHDTGLPPGATQPAVETKDGLIFENIPGQKCILVCYYKDLEVEETMLVGEICGNVADGIEGDDRKKKYKEDAFTTAIGAFAGNKFLTPGFGKQRQQKVERKNKQEIEQKEEKEEIIVAKEDEKEEEAVGEKKEEQQKDDEKQKESNPSILPEEGGKSEEVVEDSANLKT